MRTVLFVCTGNTCRSPMAEAIARDAIERGLLGPEPQVFVASAGVGVGAGGGPTTRETLKALAGRGIEHEGASKALNANMIRKADVVFTMTAEHAEAARALVPDDPEAQARIVALNPKGDIEDPLGHGQIAYDSLVEQLAELIPRRIKEVLGHEDRARIRPSRR